MEIQDLIRLSKINKEVNILTTKSYNEIISYIKSKLTNMVGFESFQLSLKLSDTSISNYPGIWLYEINELCNVKIYYDYECETFDITGSFYELFKDEIYTIYREKIKKDWEYYYKNKINTKDLITDEMIIKYDQKSLNNDILGYFQYVG